ncbi:putative uncharacterized protein (plasmid) [Bradyrhizobium diazoefficiens]|uniref:Uncharacterized protein n=1 Tax=Bradyrhizobium diazoefficiens TaxID=1355477 RepID=A0A0E4FZD3_9BRAD|nr:putative uncharacterized protein [Bradyrhizobium diazoefficiens]
MQPSALDRGVDIGKAAAGRADTENCPPNPNRSEWIEDCRMARGTTITADEHTRCKSGDLDAPRLDDDAKM